MSRLFLTVSLLVFVLSSAAYAEEPKTRIKGPITVTSDSLTADNKAHRAVFEKNVTAKTSDITIHSDRMVVHYREQGGEVTKIEAQGNVKVYQEAKVISAAEAVYYATEDRIVFTGSPRAVDGENVVTGSKMIYYIKEDRTLVEDSKVILKNQQDK
jgi:lipopolysaccharide export system protein LptA